MKNRKISIVFIVMLIEVCLCASFAYIANAQEVYQNTLRPELISQRSPQYFVKIAHILFTIAEIKKEVLEWCPPDELTFATDDEEEIKLLKQLNHVFTFFLHKDDENPTAFFRSIIMLSNVIDEFEPDYEQGHAQRVAWITANLIEKLKPTHLVLRDQKQVEEIVIAALLHDLGKIFYPASIFRNKSHRRTSVQDGFIKGHSVWGAKIAASFPGFKNVSTYIKYHHEDYNGTGYPESLKGEQIPLGSSIIRVADVVDAMLSNRTYEERKFNLKEVIDYINGQNGELFNPEVIDGLNALYASGILSFYEGDRLPKNPIDSLMKPFMREIHSFILPRQNLESI